MEQERSCRERLSSTLIVVMVVVGCMGSETSSVEAYKNYTVGDKLGWFDSQMKPDNDYQDWVSGKTFSLGDFLIFNTDTNHSVVQTYNFTTYKSCDSQGEDVTEWSTADPSNTAVHPTTVAVPLLKEGTTYFFSGDYDGDQCMHGQHFQINVTHGQGLPPSLKNSPENSQASPGPANPESGDDESAPDTNVPTSFNHPKSVPDDDSNGGDDDDHATKGLKSGCISIRGNLLGSMLGSIMVLIRFSFGF